MIKIWIVLAILFIHWMADFIFQSDWQAKNKSKSNKALFEHITAYCSIWSIAIVLYTGYDLFAHYYHPIHGYIWMLNLVLFLVITFACHFVTDYFTSRLNSKLWAAGKVHEFFVSVGFDQLLHFTQLFLTYYLLNL